MCTVQSIKMAPRTAVTTPATVPQTIEPILLLPLVFVLAGGDVADVELAEE